MISLVTGTAGFIGSHLAAALLQKGHTVRGLDCFNDYYSRPIKERNISPLLKHPGFQFFESDILRTDLMALLKDTDAVFHLAAQAGVRSSWGRSFGVYTSNNIDATQKLLEAAKATSIKKFIYASSSSVYGVCPDLPWTEASPLYPHSPYGVSKLAAEHLCSLYFRNYGVPTVSLRFFTVYGPGQRPDMAFHKFFKAILKNKPIPVFGDGSQTRDFTYIDDIVNGSMAALEQGRPGEIFNLGGGNRKTLKDLFPILESVSGRKVLISLESEQKGDVPDTYADIQKARRELDFNPSTPIAAGLEEEWKWIETLYSSSSL
ncbi:MAG: NAD-dependent epimerase/dehydratase family protein [Candidatus Aminicenantes bacterium]|nr:NAD-dependent epimerase/dehydratase family protein [Candidatus Aminicenantes bacterium]